MNNSAQLLITCILDTLYPETGQSVINVLHRLGLSVGFPPGQTCCGQPAFNAGLRELARPIAMHTIQVFEKTRGPIVIPSGSCTAMIRHGYLELFRNDASWLPRAKTIAERSYEFTEFLVDVLRTTDVGARYPGKVSYHASCHLIRDLGVDSQPLELLSAVQGAELVELNEADECCGFGGVFSVEHPHISTAMLDRKIANIEQSQATSVVSCDAGCLTNINAGLHRQGKPACVRHIAEILDSGSNDHP